MQSDALKGISEMISRSNEAMLKFQLESERRNSEMMQKIIESKQSSPLDISGISQIMELIEDIKSTASPDKENSILEKLIENPAVQNVIAGFLNPAPGTSTISTEKISDKFPKEFVDALNLQNKDTAIKNLSSQAKIPAEQAKIIIEQILKEKGL